jgi:hypothetical protein
MSGERCVHQLLSRIMMLKIRQAGGECDGSDILKIISDVDVWRGGRDSGDEPPPHLWSSAYQAEGGFL